MKRFSTGRQYHKSSDQCQNFHLSAQRLICGKSTKKLDFVAVSKDDRINFLAYSGVENLFYLTRRKLTSSGAGNEKIHTASKKIRMARLRL